ncbi:MAG: hypothetical protein IT378_02785 [Sandaracinaceae bacterium]|nr:hypothetical protein [Sandaracinaceae bacterium]
MTHEFSRRAEKFDIAQTAVGASELLFTMDPKNIRELVMGSSEAVQSGPSRVLDPATAARLDRVISLPSPERRKWARDIAVPADKAYRDLVKAFWERSTMGSEDPALASGHLRGALRAALLQGIVGMVRPSSVRPPDVRSALLILGLRVVIESRIARPDEEADDWLIEKEVPLVFGFDPARGVVDCRTILTAGGFSFVREDDAVSLVGPEPVSFLRRLKEATHRFDTDALTFHWCREQAPEALASALDALGASAATVAEEQTRWATAAWEKAKADQLSRIAKAVQKYEQAGCRTAVRDLTKGQEGKRTEKFEPRSEILLTQCVLWFT